MTVNIQQLLDPDTLFPHFAELTWVAYDAAPIGNVGCVVAYSRLPERFQTIMKTNKDAVFALWYRDDSPFITRMELKWMPLKDLYVTDPPHYAHSVETYITTHAHIDQPYRL